MLKTVYAGLVCILILLCSGAGPQLHAQAEVLPPSVREAPVQEQRPSGAKDTLTRMGRLLKQKTAAPPEKAPVKPPVREEAALPYTRQEVEMITAVVMHEVGYCSRESKMALTHVILNRLHDGRFGGSIQAVLYAKGQFDAIHNYTDHTLPPDAVCRRAVLDALVEEDTTLGALYYCNPQYISSERTRRWFESLHFLFELEGQRFYR